MLNYRKILTKKFLIKEYIQNKKSMYSIIKEIRCSCSTVFNYLKKYNIKTRSIGEALKGQNNYFYGKTGNNNYNYIDNRTNKKYHCKEKGCNNIISYNNWKSGHNRCWDCYCKFNVGKNHPMFGIHRFGKKAPGYIHGKSKEPYPLDWNKTLKESIRQRDNYRCQICGKSTKKNGRKLDIHHIDYNKENLNPINLISLCKNCHMKTNGNREIYIEFFKILKECIK